MTGDNEKFFCDEKKKLNLCDFSSRKSRFHTKNVWVRFDWASLWLRTRVFIRREREITFGNHRCLKAPLFKLDKNKIWNDPFESSQNIKRRKALISFKINGSNGFHSEIIKIVIISIKFQTKLHSKSF